jgi:hypothetical protein
MQEGEREEGGEEEERRREGRTGRTHRNLSSTLYGLLLWTQRSMH